MKRVVIGCTFFMSGIMLLGITYITGSILVIANSLKKGNADLNQAMKWISIEIYYTQYSLIIIGLFFISWGLIKEQTK
jgi:hypothetical protein